jgi:hypothetical protein
MNIINFMIYIKRKREREREREQETTQSLHIYR